MDLIFTFPIYSLYMKICSGQQIKTSVLGMLMRNYMSEGGRSWKSNQSDEHAYSDPLISPRSLWLGLDNFFVDIKVQRRHRRRTIQLPRGAKPNLAAI